MGLLERIEELEKQLPLEDTCYYFITLLGTEDGKTWGGCYSEFAGYTETKPRREIRIGSFVDPIKMRDACHIIEEPAIIVNTPGDLYIFLLIGGHAIVEQNLGQRYFPGLIRANSSILSHTQGRLTAESAPKEMTQHAPSRKLRMKVLKRDRYRCKVCGRSPDNHVDIELHVHHIHPWGLGGVTEEGNLITLCDTCHDGLSPHFDFDLFSLIGGPPYANIPRDQPDYVEGVMHYRKTSIPKRLLEVSERKV